MMNARRCLRSITILAFTLGVASAPAAETIAIGLIAPISGSVALDGQQEVAGARFAVEQANKAGGVNGKQIELFVEDGECKPATSTAAAEKLITRNEVVALAGAFCSSATKAVQPISAKYGVPFVNGISADPSLTDPLRPWFFRTKIHNGLRAKYFSKFIADARVKKLAALAVDDDFGRSAVSSFTPILKDLGIEFVLVRYFKHGEVNYISLLNAAKEAGADAFFLVGEVQDGALIMKQYHQLGLKLPVMAMGSFNTPEFFNVAGANADGVYNAEVWGNDVAYPAAKAFAKDWQATHNNAYPGLYAMSGYVEASTIIQGLAKAGEPNRAKLKAALETLVWDSPIGPIKFDANHQAYTQMFVTKNENGKGVVVKVFDTSKD
jgi:branched-chain amino acid transport system substrate-binding protein